MEIESYITGFVDGEGCFAVSFSRRAKFKLGIEVRPSFSISQNKRSLNVLGEIRDFFKCGSIRFSKSDQTYKYEVRSVSEIVKKIIPHFEKFPLKTSKRSDFKVFKEICALIVQNKHKNKEFLAKIIELAYQMNWSGKRKFAKSDLLRLLAR